jgi:histidine triad (HIT) family protein
VRASLRGLTPFGAREWWNTRVECLFCKIVAGDLPSTRVHEDDRVIAIMDIFPATRGHVLVIPRAHSTDIHEIAEDDLAAAAAVARDIAGRAMRGLGADGVTIMQSNGSAAWQTVFHYHVHVIPRYRDDPLVLPWRPGEAPADPADLADISRSYFTD